MNPKYDLVIIGSGPAGLSAAIYANRSGLSFLVLESNYVSGGQILNTDEVDNYPGLEKIKGFELGMKMHEHAKNLGTEFLMKKAVKIQDENGMKQITLEDGSKIEAANVIVATGTHPTKLGVSGEDEFRGKGVSYCATCDGNFFKGKTVAVVGGGNTALADALYLSRICEKVYLIHRRNDFRGLKANVDKVMEQENVEILWNTVIEEIIGNDCVEQIKTCNIELDMQGEIRVDGIFVAIGASPVTQILDGVVELNPYGYVIAGEDCKTSVEGIFAAGDIRQKELRQIVTAVADGANAVNSAILALNAKK